MVIAGRLCGGLRPRCQPAGPAVGPPDDLPGHRGAGAQPGRVAVQALPGIAALIWFMTRARSARSSWLRAWAKVCCRNSWWLRRAHRRTPPRRWRRARNLAHSPSSSTPITPLCGRISLAASQVPGLPARKGQGTPRRASAGKPGNRPRRKDRWTCIPPKRNVRRLAEGSMARPNLPFTSSRDGPGDPSGRRQWHVRDPGPACRRCRRSGFQVAQDGEHPAVVGL
jgi:hypothetical protein